jgi:Erv1 / Alr family
MPCSCQLPIPNYPDTVEWGPLIWALLHALAERAGRARDPFVQADERNIWPKFLRAVADVLPCPNCREHYKEWLATHPFTPLKTIPYEELGDWIRRYLFDLHNNVNERNEKPIFLWEDLAPTYGDFDFFHGYHRAIPPLKRAIELSGISFLKYNDWINSFRLLESVLNI